ncbi:MAG: SH3 domain-containing protein [Caldilineaceae bacterium]
MRVLRPFMLIVLLAALVMAGCGPSSDESSDVDAADVTKDIAFNYAGSRDMATAQAALDTLGVANTNQWLILVAEETIGQGPSGDADALTMLAMDMGLSSAIVDGYAAARGFTSSAAVAPNDAPAGQVAESASSNTAQDVSQSVAQAVSPTVSPTEAPVTDSGSAVDTSVPAADPPVEPAAEPSPEPTATDTPVPVQEAQVQAVSPMNVRAGPSTEHPIIAAMQTGTAATILAKNAAGDWWQVTLSDGAIGWIYAPLVETVGNVSNVSVAEAIPTPPPVVPTATPASQPTAPPQAPAEEPTAAPPPSDGPDFRLVEQRLWDVQENGGFLAGSSVNCGEKQVLQIIVEDASGARLNGVTVQGVYRNEIHVTGDKGDGVTQMDINKDGDDVIVLRDVDGREVSSDRAVGNTARTWDIPVDQLIQARYCTDGASCQAFIAKPGCFGHFSWTVRFRRSY